MKKLFVFVAAAFMLSCNNEKTKEGVVPGDPATTGAKVTLPQKMVYEGTPAVGKTENIVVVMNFNTDFVAGKLDNIGSYLADSVHAVFGDGTEVNTTRDSMVAVIRAWRGSMDSAKQTYISAVALDNKDMNHEWVFQWIDEEHNYKDGKKEHLIYHEDYRLEKGKIREVFQYQQAVPAKK